MKFLGETEENVYKNGYGLNNEQEKMLKRFFSFSGFNENGNIFAFDDDRLENQNEYMTMYIKEDRCKLLREYGLAITPETYDEVIATEEGQDVMSKVKMAYEVAMKCKQEFESFKQDNKEIEDYMECYKKIQLELDTKYQKKYFEKIMPYVSEEERKNIEEMLNFQGLPEWKIHAVADPNNIYSRQFLLEAFSSKYNDTINEDTYMAQTIRKKRIKYFKLKGIDLGDEYSAYESSEEVKKILPSQELINTICEKKEECENEEKKELMLRTSNYEQCKENIEKFGLCLDDEFSIDFVKQYVTCICPNVVKNEQGEYTNFNVLHFPMAKTSEQYRDIALIHEILHVVELTITQTNDTRFHIKTGFDQMDEELSTDENRTKEDDEYKHEIRQYEYMSENLHQWISMVVTKRLHDKGIYLLDDPRASKVLGYTSYEQLNAVTKAFIETYGKDIAEGMINPEMTYIYDTVGKENLEALNDIVVQYRQMPYYNMMDDVINKKDTDLTRKRTALIEGSKSVVEDMNSYRDNTSEQEYQISIQEIKKATDNQNEKDKREAAEVLSKDKVVTLKEEIKQEGGNLEQDEY